MSAQQVQEVHTIALTRGQKVIETLTAYCTARNITHAVFSAIGAVQDTSIGYYDLQKREYFFTTHEAIHEVASANGNVALVDGAPFVHMHAVLSKADSTCACIGGHIEEATVAVTLEIALTVLSEQMERQYNDEVGLKLLTCTLK